MFARSTGVLSGNKYIVVEFSSCSCEGISADLAFFLKSAGKDVRIIYSIVRLCHIFKAFILILRNEFHNYSFSELRPFKLLGKKRLSKCK